MPTAKVSEGPILDGERHWSRVICWPLTASAQDSLR